MSSGGLIWYLVGRDLGNWLGSWGRGRRAASTPTGRGTGGAPGPAQPTPTAALPAGWARCAACGWGYPLEQLGPLVPGGPWFCGPCRHGGGGR